MLVPFVALVLLVAGIAAIYLLLKNMGQEGVEVAAPGSCKSGKCGVESCGTGDGSCHTEDAQLAESEEAAQRETSRPG